jgi:hypothetical protein
MGQALPELLHAALAAHLLADLELDVVHDHSAAGPLTAPGRRVPTVVTAHRTTEGEPGRYYAALADRVALVAISKTQRRLLPDVAWAAWSTTASRSASIPIGPTRRTFPWPWAAWIQTAAPTWPSRRHRARAAGVPLVLAAKCSEPAELAYFEHQVRPHLAVRSPEWGGAPSFCRDVGFIRG